MLYPFDRGFMFNVYSPNMMALWEWDFFGSDWSFMKELGTRKWNEDGT